jgi:type I restriction enzyme S subunit
MKSTSFKELYEIPSRNGLTKPKAIRGNGIKMVNMGEIFAHSRLSNVNMDRVPLNENEKNTSLLKKGDLLFARQSLMLSGAGKCSIFLDDNEEVCFESHIIRCRLNQKFADPDYYYYFFNSPMGRAVISKIVEQGAGASGIRGSDLAEIVVPWMDIHLQRKISRILSAIDDKIATNAQINLHLEEMAQAIFKSWFWNFEPWDGTMPSNWKIITLGDVVDIKHGYAFKGEYFCNEKTDYLLVTPGNFSIGGGFQEKPKYYNGQIPKDYILKKDDLIVTMTDLSKEGDTLGYSALVPENEKYLHNQRIGLVSIKTDAPLKEYIYWLMRTREYQRFIVNHASGSTVKHTSPKTILTYPFVMPDNHTLQIISNKLRIINQKTSLNNAESMRLIALRDTLLPHLMSGELSVM